MCLFNRVVSDGPSTSPVQAVTVDTQTLINQKILDQLSAIGSWFPKI